MILFFATLSGVYVLDLLTKILVRQRMPFGQEIQFLPFFSLTHVQNTGVAFGLFQNRNWALGLLGGALTLVMGVYALRLLKKDRWSAMALAVVLGGAMGNLTDRFLYGHVTDFLDFYWRSYHWPAFNIADSAICLGATLLFLRQLRAP